MSVQTCSLNSRHQSQSVYSVDEFSELLQQEAGLDLNTSTAIAANIDQLDSAADGEISARSFYDRRLLESAVDNQLCEVPSYQRLGLTSDTLGLMQGGCRFQEIFEANEVIEKYLNPNYVERLPEPYLPQNIVDTASQPLVARSILNPIPEMEVNEAHAGPVILATLLARGGALSNFLSDLRALGRQSDAAFKLAVFLENSTLLIARYERELAQALGGRENMRALVSNGPLVRTLVPQVESLLASVRSTDPTTKEQVAQSLLETLRGGMNTLQQTAETAKANAAAARVATPVLAEAAVAVEAEGASAWQSATQAPAVQSLRSAGFSGGPYTRPLLLVAGAAVLIGAGWYWLRDE